MLNAKYSISVARKIGACVFLSPADIVEGKVIPSIDPIYLLQLS